MVVSAKVRSFFWTYGLAICCVVGPLVLGYAMPNVVANSLMPFPSENSKTAPQPTKSPFVYLFTDDDAVFAPAERTARHDADTAELKRAPGRIDAKKVEIAKLEEAKDAAGAEKSRTELGKLETAYAAARTKETDRIATQNKQIAEALAGRYNYAGASGILYAAAAAAMLLASVVVARFGNGWLLLAGIAFFVLIASAVTICPTAYENGGRLLLDALFERADGNGIFNALRDSFSDKAFDIGRAAKSLVLMNTFIALVPVGMVLLAFASVAVRNGKSSRDELAERQRAIKGLIAISSVILVIATFASKALLDWPLKLVAKSQSEAFQPLALALTNHLGITGTIALFTATLPAIVAWYGDVETFRQEQKSKAPAGVLEPDELGFEWSATLSSVFAVLAPAVVSPLFTGLQSIVGKIGN